MICTLFLTAIAGCQSPDRDQPVASTACNEALAAQMGENPGLVVVHFGADWSGPDKMLISGLENDAPQEIKLWDWRRIDVDRDRDLAAACGIRSIPTLVAVVDGQRVDQMVGANTADEIAQFLAQARARR